MNGSLGFSGFIPDEDETFNVPFRLFMYPIIVRETRYGGVYEGGSWFAYTGHGFPLEAIGDDDDCSYFWASEASKQLGIGNSPNKAVEDLVQKQTMRNNE